jgi:hypothetical protein
MVVPIGYDQIWQKFEKDVYELILQRLKSNFRVEWHYIINGLTPDVVALLECSGCEDKKDEYPCVTPAFIFDPHCKFKVEKNYFAQKDKQMKKYSKICDSILVMPQGYDQMPYCRSKGGEYHIISRHYLPQLLNSINEEVKIETEEDACGDRLTCNSRNVYRHLELSIRRKIDKCPVCKSEVFPISLIYCMKNDEFYYPDFLDYEQVKHNVEAPTYLECRHCEDHNTFDYNYNNCPESSIESKYQCKECGAIFDPETQEIIKNFTSSQVDEIKEFPYYEKLRD